MKQLIGQVSENERDEIRQLFERRNGLNELAKVLTADNNDLYEKLITDLGETSAKFQNWWNEMSRKYQWSGAENGNWEIDFQSCKIYLVTND
jgi:CXXX repeat modification system protein